MAACTVLKEHTGEPDYVAGHSLGEYSALVAAGALEFGEALRLVHKRGRYMQEAVPAGVGAMAALLRLPEGKLEGILVEAAQGEVVTPAGFNSPDQIVISGNHGAVGRAVELAKAAGAKRAVLLPVSAPFHCPLMRPAQERLLADLHATLFSRPANCARQQLAGTGNSHGRRSSRGAVSAGAESGAVEGNDRISGGKRRGALVRSGRGRGAVGAAADDRGGGEVHTFRRGAGRGEADRVAMLFYGHE